MAGQLRRGIAHYAEGDESVTPTESVPASTPLAPTETPTLPTFSTAPPPPPGGAGQLFSGNFAQAAQSPQSSPATAAIAGFMDQQSKMYRASAAAAPPSTIEWLHNLFAGNADSTAALQQRYAAANMLSHPAVQQHLVNNPSELTEAEQNPLAYAAKTQTPAFQEFMKKAADAHTEAAAHPRVGTDDHHQTVTTAVNHDIPVSMANAAVSPNKYTEDEWVNALKGIPTTTFMQLFGQRLQHVQTPAEKAANEVMDRLHGAYAKAANDVTRMEAEDKAAIDKGQPVIHSKYQVWGQNPYDTAKATRDAALKELRESAKALAGITTKFPGQP